MDAPSTADIRDAVALGHDLSGDLPALDVGPRLQAAQEIVLGCRARPDDAFEALLVTDLLNICALSGFTGSAARMVIWPDRAVFVTDGRYEERAAEELANSGCTAEIVVRRTIKEQNDAIGELIVGIDLLGLEDANVTWKALRSYDTVFGTVQLVPAGPIVEDLRRTKSTAELVRLARASAIADAAFLDIWATLAEQPSEREFADLLESRMRAYGADDVSFSSIVASGPNGSRPHHEPGSRRVVEGDAVICDFGALVCGYHSDTTRTVYVGEPSKAQLRHFGVVRKAQAAGIDAVKTGAGGAAIDAICRRVIADVGWDEYFSTGTGHGSGLQIHEEPWLGKTSTSVLAHGDITTVEPGVYIPGEAGVRIEDSMVVTDEGPVLLTRLPYDLVCGL